MPKLSVTPFGYVFGSAPAGTKMNVVQVKEIEALGFDYQQITSKNIPIDFVERVVRIAKESLGPNPISTLASLYERRGLASSCSYNYDFLRDTAEFINGSTRSMSIKSRVQLMEFHDVDKKVSFNPIESLPFGKANRFNVENKPGVAGESVYTRWLRQTDGLNDMLCTITVLFGNPNQLCCNK